LANWKSEPPLSLAMSATTPVCSSRPEIQQLGQSFGSSVSNKIELTLMKHFDL